MQISIFKLCFAVGVSLLGGCNTGENHSTLGETGNRSNQMDTVSVRYIVEDVDAAMQFYTERLGFRVEMNPAPGFAMLSRGSLRLLLNAPGAGGTGQAMPDGRMPEPGGWNRIQLPVDDLESFVESLRADGANFRNEIVTGNGGKQILIDDPAGNPIELFESFRKQDQKASANGE